MLGSNRKQRWIRWEAGIPTPHDDGHFFTDIPDWREQIMHIHEALSSLGILHNDLHPGHFMRSKADPTKLLIYDFGNSVVPNHLWLNRRHLMLMLKRKIAQWCHIKAFRRFLDDTPEYERVLRNFPKYLNTSDTSNEHSEV